MPSKDKEAELESDTMYWSLMKVVLGVGSFASAAGSHVARRGRRETRMKRA